MNAQTKLSAKGQVVIPKAVRDRLHWEDGVDLEVVETAGGVLLRAKSQRRRISLEELRAMLPVYDGPTISLDEMQAGIDEAMAERWAAKEARSR